MSNELVAVGVTCGLSEPTVTTFATKTSELPLKVRSCDFEYEAGVLTVYPSYEEGVLTVYPSYEEGVLTVYPSYEEGVLTVYPSYEAGVLAVYPRCVTTLKKALIDHR